MINEKQKKTTDKYRENYDAIFVNAKSRSQARRLSIQHEVPMVDCSEEAEDGVGGEGEPCKSPVGQGDL